MTAAAALPGMNRLVLQAQLLERGAVRYTPAGLPALDMSLKHESQLTEAGHPRKVSVEIRAVAIGEITQPLARLEIGAEKGFAGFISAQRNGRGVVFHVTEMA
ncbi:MAG: primosomal replication protein N [Burkholderiales bacterium]